MGSSHSPNVRDPITPTKIPLELSNYAINLILQKGGNRQYNDKLSVRNVSIYGNNNPATQIKFVCDEYLGANTPAKDAWKFSYKPGEAGTSDVCCKYPASAVKIINWYRELTLIGKLAFKC